MSTPSSLFTSYTDASSSYWPPGWNFDRFAHATAEDDATLSAEERSKMQAGFRDALGEDGVQEMARVVWQEQRRLKKLEDTAKATTTSLPSSSAQRQPTSPEWLKTWRKRYSEEAWGFVAFCTPAVTAMPDSEVEEFRGRVRKMVEIPFNVALEQGLPADEIAEARRLFEIRWVDDVDDEWKQMGKQGEEWTDKARAHYRAMRESGSLPLGLSSSVFLCASPEAMTSVLQTTFEEVKEAAAAKSRWRDNAPFFLVVAAETEQGVEEDEENSGDHPAAGSGGGERDWFKPVFKAAAEVLVEELWWVVEEQMTTLGRMTRFVRGATVSDVVAETAEGERQGGDRKASNDANDGGARGEESGRGDDGLDEIWWSVHMPPHRMRKRRRFLNSE
ncbi:hypothetical protein PGQ11_013416 [Apiospora arundinis]|uniref:Uncharacterized protein n=1 Tax=Apiospora arundinis TaxID=335852 RepID=A0ABR2HP75_9PEZI